MKQKVVVRAIIPQRNRVLLIRRAGGRPSIDGLYELPGGSIHKGEQPIDALKRSLQIHVGIYPETAYLHDVIDDKVVDDVAAKIKEVHVLLQSLECSKTDIEEKDIASFPVHGRHSH